jgi:ABC-type uncharacterized transport system substrate-binding protein
MRAVAGRVPARSGWGRGDPAARRRVTAAMVALALLLLLPRAAHGHPHAFVAYSFDLLFGADGLAGLRMTWEFDDFFSSLLLQTYDADRDGRLAPEEARRLEREQFAGLRAFGYYIELFLDGAPLATPAATEFAASVRDRRVVYGFTLPLAVPHPRAGVLEVVMDDPDYYVAVAHDPRAPTRVLPRGTGQATCAKSSERRPYKPLGITCAFRR